MECIKWRKKRYTRFLNLRELLGKKSHFLFGPRSTGKTDLIREQLTGDATVWDLLERDTYFKLLRSPNLLSHSPRDKIIVIDEIQKIPTLLDEVHRLIERDNRTFLLTGSSARKLKRGGANLLAGRAWRADMFPLVSHEIPNFDLETYLSDGGLPYVYGSPHAKRELKEYISLYLREEVAAEALTRSVEVFAEFLDLLGLANGQEINYQSFASDCGLSVNGIKNYFSILEDTLVGFSLPAFTKTKKRKAISRSKFYFFDVGVANALRNQDKVRVKTEAFGISFEHFIISEVRACLSYRNIYEPICYWRSVNHQEVDLVIGNEWAIEIKGTDRIQSNDLKGLLALREEGLVRNFAVVSLDRDSRPLRDSIQNIFYADFLKSLWAGEML